MIQKGVTLPNRQWDPYTDAELKALADLAPDVVVVLLYGGPIDEVHRAQLAPLRRAHAFRVWVRCYAPDIPTRDAVAWADECGLRLTPWGTEVELLPDNERNHPQEGGSNDWPAQIRWLTAFVGRWRTVAPGTLVHLSALSPGIEGWVDGLRAYRAAGLPRLFDRKDAHGYGPDAAAQIEVVALELGGPVEVTEFNGDAIQRCARLVGTAARSIIWFILGGTLDQAAYDLRAHPDEYASFKAMTQEYPFMSEPTHGAGIAKAAPLLGPLVNPDVYDLAGSDAEVCRTSTSKGWVTWTKASNETVVYVAATGEIWRDGGNHGNGLLFLTSAGFLAKR